VVEDKPELRDIPVDQLKLWEEANVRKSEVLLNIEDLAGNIKKYGVKVPLLVKEKIRLDAVQTLVPYYEKLGYATMNVKVDGGSYGILEKMKKELP